MLHPAAAIAAVTKLCVEVRTKLLHCNESP